MDYNGQVNEILYSVLTPLDYYAHVSVQKLRHIEKHVIATKHKMETMEIRMTDTVVEFILGPSKHIVFGYEDRPGFEVGRDKRSKKIVGYMALSFPQLYQRILTGLKKTPVPGRFSVESLVDTGNVTPICDPRVKNATFAEIVQWVWEKYYAHLEAAPVGEHMGAETVQA